MLSLKSKTRPNTVESLFRLSPVDLGKQSKKIPKDPCPNESVGIDWSPTHF